ATQVVRDISLLSFLIHLREELIHVRHVFIVLGLNAGLLGPDVAIMLITLVVPLTLFQFPLSLSSNEPGEIGVQLTLLVDAPFLDTVP
ncbi:hypothetical protein OFC41_30365, partial [Escherichia coli]|nr:hypothetical protein [Escherichia coli]